MSWKSTELGRAVSIPRLGLSAAQEVLPATTLKLVWMLAVRSRSQMRRRLE
jgi:hypothetical protein